MPLDAVNSPYFKSELQRYEQGDVLRDLTLVEWAEFDERGQIRMAERTLQYCVIVSQECDLEHDYNARTDAQSQNTDKYLQALLICPAYPVQEFRSGEHLKQLQMTMQTINSDNWGRVKQNNNARYHHLDKHDDFQVPELAIDFKHYLTVPRDVIYRDKFDKCYLATMNVLYRDNLSGRFAHYLSRIGLPDFASA